MLLDIRKITTNKYEKLSQMYFWCTFEPNFGHNSKAGLGECYGGRQIPPEGGFKLYPRLGIFRSYCSVIDLIFKMILASLKVLSENTRFWFESLHHCCYCISECIVYVLLCLYQDVCVSLSLSTVVRQRYNYSNG